MEDGSLRATVWPVATTILSGLRISDGTLHFGNVLGINKYNDYLDNTSTYRLKYYTNPMSFGDATRLKILKEISLTIVGGQNSTVAINWGYDHTESYSKQTFTLASTNIAEYGVSEYNVSSSEYNNSIIIDTARIKPNKSGNIVTIGVEAVINQGALSLQELNTQALIGRMI